jgi:hypothetical protein
VVLAVVVSGVLHVLWWRFVANSGGDIAAQDAWAEFARQHPGSAYNLAWYGGMHPVSYSVVAPYVMAVLGVRPTMVLAGTVSAGLLARLAVGRTRSPRRWQPALYGAVALVGNAVSGRVTFALGGMFALAALCLVFGWRTLEEGERGLGGRVGRTGQRRLRGVLTVLTSALATAASPVAGLFLGVAAATLWLSRRRAAAYALGLPPVAVVASSAVLFPFSGLQPMSWSSAILPAVTGIAVLLLAPRAWRTVRGGAAVYVVGVLLAWLVPSPIGTNISRLGLLFGGVVLVAAVTVGAWRTSVVGRRWGPRVAGVLMAMALITSTTWQVATAAKDVVSTAPPASFATDIAPLIRQLQQRHAELARVEVVPTHSHREAAAIAPYVPLARGWNRQADAERNPLFYRDRPVTARAYHEWLHRWAVHYVVLSDAAPDPAAVREAALVRAGLPYLTRVWSDTDWTLYAVADPTPLVSAPARVVSYDAAELTISVPRPGHYLVRIADSPWLSLVDAHGSPLPAPDAEPGGAGSSDGSGVSRACLTHLGAGPASGDSADSADAGGDAGAPGGADGAGEGAGGAAGAGDGARDGADAGNDGGPGAVRDDWVVLHAPVAGVYRIAAPYKLPRGTACPTLAN